MVYRICLISWISLLSITTFSQNLEETLAFGNQLFENGQYEEAIPVFERVLYFSDRKSFSDATFRLARSYQAVGDYTHAMIYYDEVYQLTSNQEVRAEVVFQKSLLYFETNNPGFALIELMSLPADTCKEHQLRKLYFLGATRMHMEQYSLAEKHFKEYFRLLRKEEQWTAMAELFADTVKIQRVNPRLAGYMSLIIPGSGQLYAHAYKEALNSFLLVGGLEAVFILTSANVSLLDAYLSVFPWWQRYYSGGFKTAKKSAILRREKLKLELYQKILAEVYHTK